MDEIYKSNEFKEMEKKIKKNKKKYIGKSFFMRDKYGNIIKGIIKDVNKSGLILDDVTIIEKIPNIKVFDSDKLHNN